MVADEAVGAVRFFKGLSSDKLCCPNPLVEVVDGVEAADPEL